MKRPARAKTFDELAGLRDALARDREETARREVERAAEAARERREADLFREMVGAVEPLKVARRVTHAAPPPAPIARQREIDEQAALAESLSDDFEPDTVLDTDDQLSWTREGLSIEVLRKLRRGHWVVQAQLDLHGARVDEARDWLGDFLRDAMKRHLRCVRVIHGKGHGSIGRQPVLKGKVKRWLAQKDEVLAWCQPPEHDGGGGVLVVLLRPS